MGNIGTLPVFLLTLALRELIPGDGIVDWIILLVGIIVACIPIPVAGLLAGAESFGSSSPLADDDSSLHCNHQGGGRHH